MSLEVDLVVFPTYYSYYSAAHTKDTDVNMKTMQQRRQGETHSTMYTSSMGRSVFVLLWLGCRFIHTHSGIAVLEGGGTDAGLPLNICRYS